MQILFDLCQAYSIVIFYDIIMKMNGRWHEAMPMTKDHSLDEQIKWHIVHRTTCGCSPIPQNIKVIMKERKIPS